MIEMIGNVKGLMDFDTKSMGGVGGDFGAELKGALEKVNAMELKANGLVERMISSPGEVSVHEVMSGLSQAELGLSMTKAVADRVINAYKEIVNLR